MDKKARSVLGVILVMTVLTVTMIYLVTADTQCSSQDCSVAASLTVGNSAPTVPTVQSGITTTLTAETSKTAYVYFDATDTNGYGDLNDTTAQCVGSKSGETSRTSSSCTAQGQSGNNAQYNCTVAFQYYDAAAADWEWNCSVSDDSVASGSNATQTFTINALNYVDVNETTATWTTVNPGVNDQEADSSINLDNGGNQNYETATVTAQNATSGSNTIPATAFSLDTDTGQTTGQTSMADNSAVAITTWFTLPKGSSSSEDLYTYVDVPAVPSGSYSSTSNWLIDITA